ncbi:MAG: O-acetylhomoserine aminocarboxypropyltransferase/cysteine synthase [Clostridia bacterium]|nr:O-acetylhomoserine aminocarboxypropyltransferase/cysteine synthase [Clostridia bacterium]
MSEQNYSFETKRIHAGYDPQAHNDSVNVPIYQTASFNFRDIDRAQRILRGVEIASVYSRVTNPTVGALEERLRQLDEGAAAIAFASGMAAITSTLLFLAEGGGNILYASSLYGGTQETLANFLTRFGVQTRAVAARHDPAAYEALIDENTRAVYLESVSNPNAELYDIEAIAEAAHRHGVPLVVDNTVATPYLFQPLKHGADIAVYSLTKGLSGHGSLIGGAVVEKGGFHYDEKRFPQFYAKSYKIRDIHANPRSPIDFAPEFPLVIALRMFYLEFLGAALSPFDAYLALQGMSTLVERLDKQVATTQKLVRHLESRAEVQWVRHPSAQGSPYAALAQRYFPRGAGALFSFGFNGTREQLREFIGALRLFSYHVNLGDVRSLIVNSAETTHGEFPPEVLAQADIPWNLVRVSVGLENADDLIADLDQAFQKAFAG